MASPGAGAELSELVTQMKGTIEQHFLPTIHDLQAKLDTETSRVEAWLQDVSHAITEADKAIGDSFVAGENEVSTAQNTIKGDKDHTVEAINTYIAHLHDSKGKAQELLGNAITHSTDVVDKLKHADEGSTATHDQLTEHFAGFGGNVDQMLATLNNHQGHILDALHTLGDQTNHHASDLAAKLQHTGEFVTQEVSSLIQTHAQHAEELVNTQKDHLTHAVGEALGGKVGEFIGHLGDFGHAGEQVGAVFDGGVGEVLGSVDQVMGLVHSIEPVLKIAEELS